MKRFFIILSITLFAITAVSAEEDGLSVRPNGQELFETNPRQLITTTFKITNSTSEKLQIIPSLTLPDGWQAITKDLPYELDPNETHVQLISFFVPQTALADRYKITYSAKSKEYPSLMDSYDIFVEVLPVTKIDVMLLKAPNYVIAGDHYKASFLVANNGNATTNISINTESKHDIPIEITNLKADTLSLSPGERKEIVILAKTDEMLREDIKHRIKVMAQVIGEEKEVTAESVVDVYPKIAGEEDDRYYRFPAILTLRYADEMNSETESGFQAEISGKGSLDREKSKFVEFKLRGKDIQDKSLFGLRDEYYIRYWTENYRLDVGDQNYKLSPLTERSNYGRGIGGSFRFYEFDVGAWTHQNRWYRTKDRMSAVYLNYSFNKKYKLGMNFLNKTNGDQANILSVYSELTPFNRTTLELEYALDGSHPAYLFHFNTSFKKINYYLNYTYGDADYNGEYNDSEQVSTSLSIPLFIENLRLSGSYRYSENNLEQNPERFSSRRERYYQSGADYRLKKTDTSLSLDYIQRDAEDQMPEPRFDYIDNSIRFHIRQNIKPLKLSTAASGEWGEKQDRLRSQNYNLERYRFSAYVKPSSNQTYGAHLNYYDTEESFRNDRISLGLSSQIKIGNRTRFNLSFQSNDDNFDGNYEQTHAFFYATLEQSLPYLNESKLTAKARYNTYTAFNNHKRFDFLLEYTIPFGIPLYRLKDVGSVRGYIYNAETNEPISDVLVKINGATTISDNEGNFLFHALSPKMYYLNIAAANLGINMITLQEMPMKIDVIGGEETRVEIGVIKAASVFGKITVYKFEQEQTLAEERNLIKSHGLSNAVITLSNGEETIRRMTDSNGEFEVGQLLPGTWNLKAPESALPDNHYYEQNEFEFDLAPGEREDVLVNVLPKVRKIKMMEIVQKITLNIKFDFDKAKIRPEAVPILEDAYESIQKHSDSKIQLEGHTCNIGVEKYNKRLSLRRAKSVMNWFVEKKNVSESRFFEPVGYGEEKPIAPNNTREGREKNRRVEIIIHK